MSKLNYNINQLQEQIKHDSNNYILINDLAIALMESNDYSGAYSQFQKAVDIQQNIQTLNNLAYFYYTEGEPLKEGAWRIREMDAIDLLKKVVKLHPLSHFPYSLLGEIYIKKNDFKSALGLLIKAVNMQPTQENLNNLGVCYYKMASIEKATEYFNGAIIKNQDQKPKNLNLLLNYGICLAQLKRTDEALQIGRELLILNQNSDDLHVDVSVEEIADIFYLAKDYQSFINVYSKLNLTYLSVEWMPPYFLALTKLGHFEKVQEALNTLIKHKQEEITQTVLDEEDWEPGGKEEIIKELKADIAFLRNSANEIIEGKDPNFKFELSIESACYLFGCKRHNNPNYN